MRPYKFQYRSEGEKEITLMPAILDARALFFANILTAGSEAEVEKVVADWAKTCKDLGVDEVIQEMKESMENLTIPTDLDY